MVAAGTPLRPGRRRERQPGLRGCSTPGVQLRRCAPLAGAWRSPRYRLAGRVLPGSNGLHPAVVGARPRLIVARALAM